MNLITVDFETYYDREYSLSKLTTEEYIRSPLFEAIGVAVKVNDGATEWFSGTHKEVKQFLQQFDWADSMTLAHNTMFDGAILSWIFNIHPRILADTLSMARPIHGHTVGGSLAKLVTHYGLGEKGTEVINALGKRRLDFTPQELDQYGRYCVNDVELTYKLFEVLSQGFPKDELKLIDLTLKMFTEPVLELDQLRLEQHLADVLAQKDALLAAIGGDPEEVKKKLMSNEQFAALLETYGVDRPTKISLTTGKTTYAFAKTDPGMKALLEHPDPAVQALVTARLGVKTTLEETRTKRFIDIANRGLLPVPLAYCAAHTHRWGGCLVADTAVTVYDPACGVVHKRITDVLADDLVWDGEEFVAHEGVQFSGYQEVISWDGVTGTPEHVVFTDAEEISLRDAMQGKHRLQTPSGPTQDDVDTARLVAYKHEA